MLWSSPHSRTEEPRYGLFGGTFDPPHIAHLFIAQEALSRLGLERVYFVPTGLPPHKQGVRITSAAHRLAMLERAITGNPGFAISTVELERPGPSYTVDTVARLTSQWGHNAQLALLVGWDMLLDLPQWRDPQAIVDMVARIVAIQRPGYADGGVEEDAVMRALPGLRAKLIKLPVPQLGISATELRTRVSESLPIRYLVPDGVAEYIAEHRLYRADTHIAIANVAEREGTGSGPAPARETHVARNVHVPDQETRP
jgi:nicotinate-nucleotide adenylyltransferase